MFQFFEARLICRPVEQLGERCSLESTGFVLKPGSTIRKAERIFFVLEWGKLSIWAIWSGWRQSNWMKARVLRILEYAWVYSRAMTLLIDKKYFESRPETGELKTERDRLCHWIQQPSGDRPRALLSLNKRHHCAIRLNWIHWIQRNTRVSNKLSILLSIIFNQKTSVKISKRSRRALRNFQNFSGCKRLEARMFAWPLYSPLFRSIKI